MRLNILKKPLHWIVRENEKNGQNNFKTGPYDVERNLLSIRLIKEYVYEIYIYEYEVITCGCDRAFTVLGWRRYASVLRT